MFELSGVNGIAWPPCHVVANQEYLKEVDRRQTLMTFSIAIFSGLNKSQCVGNCVM